MTKEKQAILFLGILCISLIIVGFYVAGTPISQKFVRFDEKRLSDFSQIRYEAEGYHRKNKTLPDSLNQLPNVKNTTDPENNKPYTYEKTSNTQYKLCTSFSNDYETFKKLGGNQYFFGPEQQVNFGKGYSCLELVLPEYIMREERVSEAPIVPEAAPF